MTMGVTTPPCSTPIINFSSYYRKRAASVELPDATAWLEHLTLDMATVTGTTTGKLGDVCKGSRVQYELRASYAPPGTTPVDWRVRQPFDAYRRFRKSLLRRLQPGHVCPAECKWLYAVLKNHFPKPRLLLASSTRTAESRRQALIRMLRTLQASLVNRGNQGCVVLVQSVCREFSSFIVGDAKLELSLPLSGCSSDQSTRDSSASFASNSSDSEDDEDLRLVSPFDDLFSSVRHYAKSESGL